MSGLPPFHTVDWNGNEYVVVHGNVPLDEPITVHLWEHHIENLRKISDPGVVDRINEALAGVEAAKNRAAALHNTSEYSHLAGKAEGLALAASYFDRSPE